MRASWFIGFGAQNLQVKNCFKQIRSIRMGSPSHIASLDKIFAPKHLLKTSATNPFHFSQIQNQPDPRNGRNQRNKTSGHKEKSHHLRSSSAKGYRLATPRNFRQWHPEARILWRAWQERTLLYGPAQTLDDLVQPK